MKPQILTSLFSSAWAFLCLLCTRGHHHHHRRRVRRKRYLYIPLLLTLIASLAIASDCLSGD